MRKGSNFIILHVDTQLSKTVEKTIFSPLNCYGILLKTNSAYF